MHLNTLAKVYSLTLPEAALGLLLLGTAWLLCFLLYNAYFHRLSRFPGPFWATQTNYWGRYHNLYGQKAHQIHKAHQKYGKL